MKKQLFLLLFLAMGSGVLAQKSYLEMKVSRYSSGSLLINGILFAGDVPDGLGATFNGNYGCYYIDLWSAEDNTRNAGYWLNRLAEEGFVVEHISNFGASSIQPDYYLLSRRKILANPNDPEAVPTKAAADKAVKEVARYNLQGMPVEKDAKGVQIVVYSNYTTKTVIVE